MSVFTGSLPSSTGVYENEAFWEQPLRRKTYLEHIRESGYYCFGAGKVFHGNFDYALAGRTMAPNAAWRDGQQRKEFWDEFSPISSEPLPPSRPLNRMFDFSKFEEVSPWNHHFDWGVLPERLEQLTPDHATVEATKTFLASPPKRPFFCAVGLYKPHLPWYSPKRFFDLYPKDRIRLPFVREDDLDDVPDIGRRWALSPPDHETIVRNGEWESAVQAYLAAISYCDSFVGQIIAALNNSPAAEETITVLWGDNGFHLGEKLHWRKFALWEEATRVPLIIVPPRGRAVRPQVDDPVSLMDIFPTLCEMCGLDPLTGVDGVSLTSMMDQPSTRSRAVVTTWLPGNHSLRFEQWRYTRYSDGSKELYNHSTDPYEWTNLSEAPTHSDIVERMDATLNKELNGEYRVQPEFFEKNDLFVSTSSVGNWPIRLNARYSAIIASNRSVLSGARILDIASHDGRWSYAALDAGAAHVTGVEIRPELVEAAERNFRQLGVSTSRYLFEIADVFTSKSMQNKYDVVLCLGFFYHTLRHIETVELITRSNPHTIILDTMISRGVEKSILLMDENIDDPANGLDNWSVNSGKIVIGHPTANAVKMMFNHYGYEVTEYDWAEYLSAKSIPYEVNKIHSSANPVGDYGNGLRTTFICRKL